MHLLFELIGLVFLCMLFVGLFALGLMIFGVVIFTETHNPLYLLLTLFGIMIMGSLD